MSQPTLFDALPPAARLTDPETSRAAAETNPNGRRTDRDRVLELLTRHRDGLTDYELADALGKQQNSIGKRRSELTAAGLVEWAGTHRPAPSGSLCRVWRLAR